jgi:two-component system, OmpR family, alkaline phosphatase synthesis response regulator PhoP
MTKSLEIDAGRGEVLLDGKPVDLRPTERGILMLLSAASDRVLTRQEILDGLHGKNYAITDRAVDVQVASLRKKLGTAGARIETVRGVGFRLAIADRPSPSPRSEVP